MSLKLTTKPIDFVITSNRGTAVMPATKEPMAQETQSMLNSTMYLWEMFSYFTKYQNQKPTNLFVGAWSNLNFESSSLVLTDESVQDLKSFLLHNNLPVENVTFVQHSKNKGEFNFKIGCKQLKKSEIKTMDMDSTVFRIYYYADDEISKNSKIRESAAIALMEIRPPDFTNKTGSLIMYHPDNIDLKFKIFNIQFRMKQSFTHSILSIDFDYHNYENV